MQSSKPKTAAPTIRPVVPWNKGPFVGPKPPLKPKQVWSTRLTIQRQGRIRDLALFDLAVDSKLRRYGLVHLRIGQIVINAAARHRATNVRPETLIVWLTHRGGGLQDVVFPTPAVLSRKAVVYVRQFTPGQVQANGESTRRRYELVDAAPARGFRQVEVIDDHLGRSASGTVVERRSPGPFIGAGVPRGTPSNLGSRPRDPRANRGPEMARSTRRVPRRRRHLPSARRLRPGEPRLDLPAVWEVHRGVGPYGVHLIEDRLVYAGILRDHAGLRVWDIVADKRAAPGPLLVDVAFREPLQDTPGGRHGPVRLPHHVGCHIAERAPVPLDPPAELVDALGVEGQATPGRLAHHP